MAIVAKQDISTSHLSTVQMYDNQDNISFTYKKRSKRSVISVLGRLLVDFR